MIKDRNEVIELMLNAFQDKNKEMAMASGMTEDAIKEHIEQSNPSITLLLDSVYESLANAGVIES
jgi:hypothetical protein